MSKISCNFLWTLFKATKNVVCIFEETSISIRFFWGEKGNLKHYQLITQFLLMFVPFFSIVFGDSGGGMMEPVATAVFARFKSKSVLRLGRRAFTSIILKGLRNNTINFVYTFTLHLHYRAKI